MIESISEPQHSPVDEERKVSRFGFARGRQTSTAASSPLQSVSPLASTVDHDPFHQNTDDIPPHIIQSWQRGHDVNMSFSHGPSPMNQATQVQPMLMQPSIQFPSINNELSEAQLRNFILSSQERANGSTNPTRTGGNSSALLCFFRTKISVGSLIPSQPFEDPAIMSLSYLAPANQEFFAPMAYGPPPGLSAPQRAAPPPMLQYNQGTATDIRNAGVRGEHLLQT
jgi:CCR4-NOT transcription complex subunit 4